jgi:hypothetical protein
VWAGEIDANGVTMVRGDAAYITGAGLLDVASRDAAELLIVDTPL